jgi:uncharacterized protein (DUF1778 family)
MRPPARRKPLKTRVNMPLALPLAEAEKIHRAVDLTDESRNEFVRIAAVARADEILAKHGELITADS